MVNKIKRNGGIKVEQTKEELIKKGWTSIGYDGALEYLGKESEDGEILYIPVHEGKSIGNVRSLNRNVIALLHSYVTV